MKNLRDRILPQYRHKNVELKEPDDHTLQLYIEGKLIATFSREGVTLGAIVKELDDYDRRN